MDRYFSTFLLLFMSLLIVAALALEDRPDQHDHRRLPPLARHFSRVAEPSQGAPGTTTDIPPSRVTTLIEAITLAVMSGICGPSLFALIACGIRQIRLTWDDPFAGGKRPVDESANRRKSKRQKRQPDEDTDDDDDGDDVGGYTNGSRMTSFHQNNLDSMNLDRVPTLDLDKIRMNHKPGTQINNNNKSFGSKINKGYSKTAEDIL